MGLLDGSDRKGVVIVLRGGTGYGKTAVGRELCAAFGGVLCSRDNVWSERAGG